MHDLSVVGKKKKKGMRQKKKKYIVMMRSRQKKITEKRGDERENYGFFLVKLLKPVENNS